MVGAGFGPYAVMGYVIANQQPGADGVFRVDLNTKLLATTFGEDEGTVVKAVEFLCAPDAKSTTPTEEGRRLVKEGPFLYRVVNGATYAKIRNEEERREQNRLAQERHRAKKKEPKPQKSSTVLEVPKPTVTEDKVRLVSMPVVQPPRPVVQKAGPAVIHVGGSGEMHLEGENSQIQDVDPWKEDDR